MWLLPESASGSWHMPDTSRSARSPNSLPKSSSPLLARPYCPACGDLSASFAYFRSVVSATSRYFGVRVAHRKRLGCSPAINSFAPNGAPCARRPFCSSWKSAAKEGSYALEFSCRPLADGWSDMEGRPVVVVPTRWRPWRIHSHESQLKSAGGSHYRAAGLPPPHEI